jgi:predicted ester cyclase
MVTEDNKALVRRFFLAFETNDQGALKELLSPEMRAYLPGDAHPLGRDAFLDIVERWNRAFSYLHFSIEHQIAEADSVASRVELRGTHDQGAFLDLLPSGREIQVDIVTIERIRHSQIVERWVVFDLLGFLHQLNPEEAGSGGAASER